jgi:hypothetical protein
MTYLEANLPNLKEAVWSPVTCLQRGDLPNSCIFRITVSIMYYFLASLCSFSFLFGMGKVFIVWSKICH